MSSRKRKSPTPGANGSTTSTTTDNKNDASASPAPSAGVSVPLLLVTTALSCVVAFALGTAYRAVVVPSREHGLGLTEALNIVLSGGGGNDGVWAAYNSKGGTDGTPAPTLPVPRLHKSKTMPVTRYTGESFPEDGKGRDAVRSSHDLHIQPHTGTEENTCGAGGSDDSNDDTDGQEVRGQCGAPAAKSSSNASAAAATDNADATTTSTSSGTTDPVVDDDEEHLPAGQHLLVDIKNVDHDFLDSEERLAQAMVDVVNLSQLTLLSYHCHALIPKGVSCVGVLLESHISFHTWPDEGVITLDLFTCGSGLLVPVVPTIEKLFGIPQDGAGQYHPPPGTNRTTTYVPREEDYHSPPTMVWSHVLRGFRPDLPNGRWRPLESDVATFALGVLELDYKNVITSTVTPYQQIDVVDVINAGVHGGSILGYERSQRTEIPTYESDHPELFRPNRMVFLDGNLQSTSRGDEAYHEALVHPAMFAHSGPERVAIIGGGEGATLREVLKHQYVTNVTMVEIDEIFVNISREVLPGWSDCSDFGPASSCFDDPRTELTIANAFDWFTERFPIKEDVDEDEDFEEEEDEDYDDGTFDVIIMDALDPDDYLEFSEALYVDEVFLGSVYEALSDDGVLVMQLGATPYWDDPSDDISNANRYQAMKAVEDFGFESMHIYEESHSGFFYHGPWSFLVACKKSVTCRYNWHMNEAEVEVQIHRRILPTKTGGSPLRYFDGATMSSYQVPPKQWETAYCRLDPIPDICRDDTMTGYSKRVENYNIDNFEVRLSSIGENAGRGLYAKVDIPAGSYVALDEKMTSIHFSPTTTYLMETVYHGFSAAAELAGVLDYMHGYGVQEGQVADYGYLLDSGIITFVNHGCDGTNNIGNCEQEMENEAAYQNEATIDLSKFDVPPTTLGRKSTFDPVFDRHLPHYGSSTKTCRDIKAGEELYQNYLYFTSWSEDWEVEVAGLRAQCRGDAVGTITQGEKVRSF